MRWGEVNRVDAVTARAGGKGVNVARVLGALGHDAVVTGLAGGLTGDAVRADLAAAGLADATVPITGESRRTVVVDEAGGAPTGFWEPGPEVDPIEWTAFVDAYRGLLADARAVVLAGSLPRGVATGTYAGLIELARDAGVPAVLDADGEPLRAALGARPAIAKPNRSELDALATGAEPQEGAERLRAAGCESVVVSLGADGLLAVTPGGSWRAVPPEDVTGNPTGAGDAAVAALTAGLAAGTSWPERLADAAALSAAAVHAPVAGDFDAAAYARYREAVRAVPAA